MSALQDLDWDDVRFFLATMRSTSLREAAERLGVSHPTARRHLASLEQSLGLQLFDRRRDGLHATAQAADLAHAAEEVERAMLALGRVARASEPELRGSIRVTMPEIFASDLLMPDLAAFSARWPEIDLELDLRYSLADLSRREADLAIRAMPHGKPPQEDLVGRKAVTAYQALYGEGERWVGWYGAERDPEWIGATALPHLPIRHAMANPLAQRAACAAGLGVCQLPCFLGDPELPRRTEPEPGFDVWVLVHPDLRRMPRLRVFRDAMVSALKGHEARLQGAAAPYSLSTTSRYSPLRSVPSWLTKLSATR